MGPVLSEGSALDMEARLLSTPWTVPQGASQDQVAQDGALKHVPGAHLLLSFSYLLVPKQYINRHFLLLAPGLSQGDRVNQAAATGSRDLPPQDTDQGEGIRAAHHGTAASAHAASPTATDLRCS